MLNETQRQLLQTLWEAGPLSRWELHERTGLTPNRVGTVVESLVAARLLRECTPEAIGAGRPRVPLEIDPSGRHLIGLALEPTGFTLCRLNLLGELVERIATPEVPDATRLIKSAATALGKAINPQTLGIGVTSTGFMDSQSRTLLLSSATPGQKDVSLRPLYAAAADVPLVLGNDMHALAARWSLSHRTRATEDTLIVWFDDGRIGAAVLVDGRPNRGCFTGGNELGHMRFFADTERCFCGQTGCLERVFSNSFLKRHARSKLPALEMGLMKRLERLHAADEVIHLVMNHLCTGLSNAVNFLRAQRLILISPLAESSRLRQAVLDGTKALLMPPLDRAVSIEFWDQPAVTAAQNAAWLANAELLWTGWDAAPSDLAEPAPAGLKRRAKVTR
ncbi:MAG: sugar kinase [Phycisphaerales bacterium]|nr:sugar kinase [Phycisphaerales bacterium]